MEAEKILEALRRQSLNHTKLLCAGGTTFGADWWLIEPQRRKEFAAEIAKLCEEDKWRAIRAGEAAWHDIEDEHIARLAAVREIAERVKDADIVNEWKELKQLVDLALSAAPKVADENQEGDEVVKQKHLTIESKAKTLDGEE